MKNKIPILFLLAAFAGLSSFILQQQKPTLFFIGDSTVKNGKGDGSNGLWGWGDFMAPYFDTTKISVVNNALGGTSSRSFQTQGHWDKVLAKVKSGDYVMIQFGHNDSSPVNDSSRARGTIKGIGEEVQDIDNLLTKKKETVHSYGWYLTKFVNDIKAKGATPIICSPIPRNDWKDGKVIRNNTNSYGEWAKQVAIATNTYFIDLNTLTANLYDELGQEKVKPLFPQEHTHTGKEGAIINAKSVVMGLTALSSCKLVTYLK